MKEKPTNYGITPTACKRRGNSGTVVGLKPVRFGLLSFRLVQVKSWVPGLSFPIAPFQGQLGLRLLSSLPGVFEAVAFSTGFDDVHSVGQAVEHRSGQSLASHHFGPLFEG